MNLFRFIRKCLTDPTAAVESAGLVARSIRSRLLWAVRPTAVLRHKLPTGGLLLLDSGHSFTHAFYPAVNAYEPDVRAAVKRYLKPGDVFLDCGSNIGYFSVMANDIVGKLGRVISVEANPTTFKLLRRNLDANGFGTPVHCALTDVPGDVEIFIPKGGDVYSSLKKGGLVTGEDIISFSVPGRTLDEVAASLNVTRVSLLKIDVEGAEMQVLRSAAQTLKEMRPVVLCEYSTHTWGAFGATSNDLIDLIDELGYEAGLFDVKTNVVTPLPPDVWSNSYINLVLTPRQSGTTSRPA